MIYETIKILSRKKGLSINQLEKTLGLSKGSLCRIDTNRPSVDRLQKIADFFEVSLDYLMTGKEEPKSNAPELTARDERDIARDLETLRDKLANKEMGPAAFDGDDIPDEDAELFLGQVELMLRRLKVKNKEKYNPYKNKK